MDPIFPASLCLTIAMFLVYTSKTEGKRDFSLSNIPLDGTVNSGDAFAIRRMLRLPAVWLMMGWFGRSSRRVDWL